VSDHDHPVVTGRSLALDHPDLPELLRFFHGHIGPYAVLGYRIGRRALGLLEAEKYFGMQVTVTAPKRTPYTCLIDGLQVSTGCTTGKGNIAVRPSEPPAGVLFSLQFVAGERRLSVTVPEQVRELLAGWLQAKLTEDELFAKVRDCPANGLWEEVIGGTPTP
jgi:hypothetical protein